MLNKRIMAQLAVFIAISLVGGSIMAFRYMELPDLLLGVGRYEVTVQLPKTGGLYKNSNVTYRGVEVGRVENVAMTDTGVSAVLALKSGVRIPADLDAEVHSQSAIGEQYVTLVPRSGAGPLLKDGDVIPVERTVLPPDINELLDATNRGLRAIPGDDLRTAVGEAKTAVGGLGPELSRFVKGSTRLAIDAHENLEPLTTLIDQSTPLLNTQIDTADSIQRWAANLAGVTEQLRAQDDAAADLIKNGASGVDQARQLFDSLQPTLPIVLANLVSVGDVAVAYQPNLEQVLVLIPPLTEILQGAGLANRNTKQGYRGAYLSFNLNVNLPPPCLTGYLPARQARAASLEDFPDRPEGELYCRIPQDAMFNVRGARNVPCATRPGKRAPTVKMCESDEEYVPLNDGWNWKGDPNATITGQDIPQLPPGTLSSPSPSSAPPPAIAVAEYNPATGSYIGPDGQVYTQTDLSRTANKEQTWQSMMMPPNAE
ncbi:MCE family protein [Mycolicibacter sinensis]|jgi:phospholipid/cholesterol/gamma-HCH transport system substrate-binding protein|uniref:Mammalian cell entry protein n=1 Tax=Mycolicibacter sinensis (strain JDM601) TaxID=875328 RepID=A0A1A2ELF0_MYCSD|nr:MlaD family protein [Mycolicibacter sinensis]OBF99081.1 mammalian cell entry protein [Mycolicibacter sinensis]OBG05977.1 mammalian cell entry protein [Mycolicibacter sinensis]